MMLRFSIAAVLLSVVASAAQARSVNETDQAIRVQRALASKPLMDPKDCPRGIWPRITTRGLEVVCYYERSNRARMHFWEAVEISHVTIGNVELAAVGLMAVRDSREPKHREYNSVYDSGNAILMETTYPETVPLRVVEVALKDYLQRVDTFKQTEPRKIAEDLGQKIKDSFKLVDPW